MIDKYQLGQGQIELFIVSYYLLHTAQEILCLKILYSSVDFILFFKWHHCSFYRIPRFLHVAVLNAGTKPLFSLQSIALEQIYIHLYNKVSKSVIILFVKMVLN